MTHTPAHVEAALRMLGAEAHPSKHRWYVEVWEVDRWMLASSFGDSREWANQRAAALRARSPHDRFRIVRETTSHTTEDPQ